MSGTRIGLEIGSTSPSRPVSSPDLLGRRRSSWEGFDRAGSSGTSRRPSAATPARWVSEQRAAITDTLLHAGAGRTTVRSPRDFIRRTAWHVLDHAWELEDQSR